MTNSLEEGKFWIQISCTLLLKKSRPHGVCIYLNPSSWAEGGTRFIFQQSTVSLNSVFLLLNLLPFELFEIELFICIKMDLALITYNSWCAIKPNQSIMVKINLVAIYFTQFWFWISKKYLKAQTEEKLTLCYLL